MGACTLWAPWNVLELLTILVVVDYVAFDILPFNRNSKPLSQRWNELSHGAMVFEHGSVRP